MTQIRKTNTPFDDWWERNSTSFGTLFLPLLHSICYNAWENGARVGFENGKKTKEEK